MDFYDDNDEDDACTLNWEIKRVLKNLTTTKPRISNSQFFRGGFPSESSQWKICSLVIEDIEDNEEILKRNLVTLALCGLVIIVNIINIKYHNSDQVLYFLPRCFLSFSTSQER